MFLINLLITPPQGIITVELVYIITTTPAAFRWHSQEFGTFPLISRPQSRCKTRTATLYLYKQL